MKHDSLFLLGLGALLLLGGGGTAYYYMKQRGIRNNNPGNIRKSSTAWKGKGSPVVSAGQTPPPPDSAFEQFTLPVWGIRAMYRILLSYQARGLKSVREIINTWAPPSENDTDSYVNAGSNSLGVSPDTPLTMSTHGALLLAFIIKHENGVQPYSMQLITQAMAA